MASPSFVLGTLLLICACAVNAQNWPASSTGLPGFLAPSPNSLAVFNHSLYLIYRGTDNGILIAATSDPLVWGSATELYGGAQSTSASPALISFQNQLVLAFHSQTTNNILTAVSANGITFSTPVTLPNTYLAGSAPVFAIFNQILYLAFQGTNGEIYIATSIDGVTWPAAPTLVYGTHATTFQPALFGFNGQLVLVFHSYTTNNLLTSVSSDGVTFGSPTTLPSFYLAGSAPVLAASGNNLYLLWQGTDFKFNIVASADGTTWPQTLTKILLSDSTAATPALIEFNRQLVLTFHSQTTNNLLLAATTA